MTTTVKKLLAGASLAAASMFAASAAHAGGNVYWSIGIDLPLDPYGASVGTTISNAPRPVYRPAPVYVQPAPVYYYAPPPVYYAPAPVVYQRPVIVRPRPVYIAYPSHRHGWRDDRGQHHWKHRDRDRDHDGRGDRRHRHRDD